VRLHQPNVPHRQQAGDGENWHIDEGGGVSDSVDGTRRRSENYVKTMINSAFLSSFAFRTFFMRGNQTSIQGPSQTGLDTDVPTSLYRPSTTKNNAAA
jgi:hypothetical protein